MSTADLIATLEASLSEAQAALAAATTAAAIEDLKVRYLGRNGQLTGALKSLGTLPAEDRPMVGQVANRVKQTLTEALAARAQALSATTQAGPPLDVTLPGRRREVGHAHPLTAVTDEIVGIFRRMGFVVATGPDLEDEFHNFDALNTPNDHPSRDLQDTLYLWDGRLLRTQTSTVQVRVMERQQPPVRIVAPGRCFRRDTPDATHSMTFHQVEGLYVAEKVSLADLKGTLLEFAREIFGRDVKIRLRPHFFPFTEPSLECDVWFDRGTGKESWLEIAGAGMVHPNVLRAVGYDPERYTGYAFGLGVERIAMVCYRIPDIRLFYENDLRFLRQF